MSKRKYFYGAINVRESVKDEWASVRTTTIEQLDRVPVLAVYDIDTLAAFLEDPDHIDYVLASGIVVNGIELVRRFFNIDEDRDLFNDVADCIKNAKEDPTDFLKLSVPHDQLITCDDRMTETVKRVAWLVKEKETRKGIKLANVGMRLKVEDYGIVDVPCTSQGALRVTRTYDTNAQFGLLKDLFHRLLVEEFGRDVHSEAVLHITGSTTVRVSND